MEITLGEAKLAITQGDITLREEDAIVNAANSSLMGGGGVDGAIHHAGGPSILEECKRIVARSGRLPTGKAVITTAGNMKTKHVIHTVGPIWHGGVKGEAELLASAYGESMKLADETGLKSIAFPSVSTGVYSYPVAEAANIALNTVADFLGQGPTSLKSVVFVLFGESTFAVYAAALKELAAKKGLDVS